MDRGINEWYFQKTLSHMTSLNAGFEVQLSSTKMLLEEQRKQTSSLEEEAARLRAQVAVLENKLTDSDMVRRKLHNLVQELKVSTVVIVKYCNYVCMLLYCTQNFNILNAMRVEWNKKKSFLSTSWILQWPKIIFMLHKNKLYSLSSVVTVWVFSGQHPSVLSSAAAHWRRDQEQCWFWCHPSHQLCGWEDSWTLQVWWWVNTAPWTLA